MDKDYELKFETVLDPVLQRALESIDAQLRARHGLAADQSSAGVLDLKAWRLAMVRADDLYYAASVAKIGILLAYFQLNPRAASGLASEIRHELGLMIKASSNEMATRYSRLLGLNQIQAVLNGYGFYDANRGGGIWMGKHYGQSDERIGDPIGGHSHAATVRQLLRFYLLLEQRKLVSPEASETMWEIFESLEISHDEIKFVAALANRRLSIIRKWGSWEDWLHDSAVISGPGRRYVLIGLTHHASGDNYLADLAVAVDDLLSQ
jgi:beta-lactamase class A